MKFSIQSNRKAKELATSRLDLLDIAGTPLPCIVSFDTSTMMGKRADGSEVKVASFRFVPANEEEEEILRDFLPKKLQAHLLPVDKRILTHLLDRKLLSEAAYIVGRGARPIALLGCIDASEEEEREVWRALLESCSFEDATIRAFVLHHTMDGDKVVTFGYAQHQWAVDLLKHAYTNTMPECLTDILEGVLLGYSSEAIQKHYERCKIREEHNR